MNMKRSVLLISAVLFFLASGVVSASSKDEQSGKSRVVTVLVNVDAQGKVSDVSSPYKLRPAFIRVIQNTLDKMITEPAINHGKPIPCQFVANLRMNLVPAANGNYGVSFTYISSKPLPSGSWYWVRTRDRRIALWNQSANDLINIADVKSPKMLEADANNRRFGDMHRSFMNQYGPGSQNGSGQ